MKSILVLNHIKMLYKKLSITGKNAKQTIFIMIKKYRKRII